MQKWLLFLKKLFVTHTQKWKCWKQKNATKQRHTNTWLSKKVSHIIPALEIIPSCRLQSAHFNENWEYDFQRRLFTRFVRNAAHRLVVYATWNLNSDDVLVSTGELKINFSVLLQKLHFFYKYIKRTSKFDCRGYAKFKSYVVTLALKSANPEHEANEVKLL